ncbi:MAG: hypothetical protein R2795_22915 [Saprospiraceae bacterium]
MKTIITFSLCLLSTALLAQWAGTYNGTLNEDQITLTLQQQGSSVSGTLSDSYQSFIVQGQATGNQLLVLP